MSPDAKISWLKHNFNPPDGADASFWTPGASRTFTTSIEPVHDASAISAYIQYNTHTHGHLILNKKPPKYIHL